MINKQIFILTFKLKNDGSLVKMLHAFSFSFYSNCSKKTQFTYKILKGNEKIKS